VRAEIVGVGTELLLGQIANTNAQWMSERLALIGVDVLHHQVVGDNRDRIVSALELAADRADVVLVTGGLGPTQDDVTRDAIAAMLRASMVRRTDIESMLRAKFRAFGRGDMPESNLGQADVPEGARAILPTLGTAPGLVAELPGGSRLYAVPGVPAEMVEMMEGTILPELAAAEHAAIVSRVLRCTGIGESRVGELLSDLYEATTNPSVAFLATGGEVKVRLTAKAMTVEEAGAMVEPLVEEVGRRLGDAAFSTHDESLEEVVGRLLVANRKTVACAESLTGGEVGARITSVPGASRYFRGSAVVYSAQAKRDILGVSRETLEGPGAVSEACAVEMAAGARRAFDADVAVALTGAAGPDSHDGAPAGTVWVALDAGDVRHARGIATPGERDRVRRWAEQAALDLLRRHLEGRQLPVSDRVI
jgi:nicotinamide-nucleotide amidase